MLREWGESGEHQQHRGQCAGDFHASNLMEKARRFMCASTLITYDVWKRMKKTV